MPETAETLVFDKITLVQFVIRYNLKKVDWEKRDKDFDNLLKKYESMSMIFST